MRDLSPYNSPTIRVKKTSSKPNYDEGCILVLIILLLLFAGISYFANNILKAIQS